MQPSVTREPCRLDHQNPFRSARAMRGRSAARPSLRSIIARTAETCDEPPRFRQPGPEIEVPPAGSEPPSPPVTNSASPGRPPARVTHSRARHSARQATEIKLGPGVRGRVAADNLHAVFPRRTPDARVNSRRPFHRRTTRQRERHQRISRFPARLPRCRSTDGRAPSSRCVPGRCPGRNALPRSRSPS